ncbi:MAG: class I SAM-dependent methyltransferase [Ktedonobacteraceae bacterium]|nr:class I SAM-dependent methyltransferase [Ktedonobacteraceae bacterium]
MNLLNRIKVSLLAGQHGHPTGIVGYMLGEQMVRQHIPETTWTISLLDLKPEDQILELGFGAGRAIELVAAQASNGHIAGIDLSQDMLRAASRRNARAIKAGQVALYHGDLSTLPFADNQFDKVFSIQTLYFWPDPPRALAEIFRVLKAGALLVVTLSTGKIDPDEVTGLERYQMVLEEQLIPAMKQLGFTEASIKQGPASRQFKTTALIGAK